jgi:hypothetical protein
MLYFQYDLQRKCCNKLHYCSTQKRFIPVNYDGSHCVSVFIKSQDEKRYKLQISTC